MEVPQYKSRAGARLGLATILLVVLILLASAAMFSVVHKADLSHGREERHYQRSELSDKVKIKRKMYSTAIYFTHAEYCAAKDVCNYIT